MAVFNMNGGWDKKSRLSTQFYLRYWEYTHLAILNLVDVLIVKACYSPPSSLCISWHIAIITMKSRFFLGFAWGIQKVKTLIPLLSSLPEVSNGFPSGNIKQQTTCSSNPSLWNRNHEYTYDTHMCLLYICGLGDHYISPNKQKTYRGIPHVAVPAEPPKALHSWNRAPSALKGRATSHRSHG